ncbi:MAG: hypothetical protein Q3988_00585 [Gemella sp.]|nr:hypothetical protein [Gemella sp.]
MKLNKKELVQLCLTPVIIYFITHIILKINSDIVFGGILIYVTNFLSFAFGRENGRKEEREHNKK